MVVAPKKRGRPVKAEVAKKTVKSEKTSSNKKEIEDYNKLNKLLGLEKKKQ